MWGSVLSEQCIPPPAVLIVDDNPLIVNVIQSLLQAENYQVCTSSNGQEALQVLDKQEIDVIVCDVMMPTMDGYELHDMVRRNPSLSHIPFIFLTALGDRTEVNRGRETGADDYLVKPFDPRSLLSIIKGKIKRSRSMKAQSEELFNAYRRKVVHTLSHEFRTPLVAINTGSELLLDQGAAMSPEKAQHLLQAIRRGGQRLERLVNDFMLLQQIEAGIAQRLFESRAKVVNLKLIAERFIATNAEDLARDGFSMSLHGDGADHPVRVYEPYLADIVGRLVSNAVKFKKDDQRIEIHVLGIHDHAVLEVRDHGIGMDVNRAREALDLFAQLDREKLEQQGTGMGLALASRYARIHGGHLELRANDGGGSIVSVVLKEERPA